MLTLLVALDIIRCFEEDALLRGIMQQKQFTVLLNPSTQPTLHCISFNATNSNATLNYDVAGAPRSVSADFFYTSGPLVLTFEVPDDAEFALMTNASIISYTINLGSILPVQGTFAKIQHTQINTSNCWQDVALVYNMPNYLEITATPNDCQITTPIVSFQYQIGQRWISIPIEPNSTSPEGGYKLPFSHMDTKSYSIYADSDSKLLDEMAKFFTEFEKNRQVKVRLSLSFSQAGSALTQEIFGLSQTIKTVNSSCLEELHTQSILTKRGIYNVGNLSSLASCYGNVMLRVSSVFYGLQYIISEPAESLSMKTSISFDFSIERPEILIIDISDLTQQIYITFLDSENQIIAEETYSYQPIQSCFYDIKTLVSFEQSCLVLFPTLTERCLELYKDGVITQQQLALQMNSSATSRTFYQVYHNRIFMNNISFYKQCFSEKHAIKEGIYTLSPGNYAQRQKKFIKNLKWANQASISIASYIDYQFTSHVGIDETSLIRTFMIVVFALILIAMIVLIVISVLKIQ